VNRIRILTDSVANQIAAGEVIERPASLLKELVENAIDAQARRIRVEIRGGGKSLIQVTDDGHGMSRDDALLCLERHATSKIRDSADIAAIRTLGFRGEAIPSMAAVSRFHLLTREPDTAVGTELEIHGGKLLFVREAGCAAGTQVAVRNLFYNLPARKKFLRSDATEIGHLHHVFLLHAIAQPRIAWTLQYDSRIVHELPPASDEPQVALLARVRGLHGPQLAGELLPVGFERDGVRIHGLIGKPGLSRSNRSELYCFVNSRPVDSRAVYYGLIEGYHTALMRGRYPVCFLFVQVDPALVDVNIHPAKREVRFREDARIQGTVIEAIRRALGTNVPAPIGVTLRSQPPQPQPPGIPAGMPTIIQTVHPPSIFPPQIQVPFQVMAAQAQGANLHAPPIANRDSQEQVPRDNTGSLTLLGVFADLYVVAMDTGGLIIVDQHAAHERILFEQMMNRLGRESAPSQRLLLPQSIELSPRDAVDLRAHVPLLESMGFGIAEFGERNFIVDALPPFVKIETLAQLLRSIVDELREAGRQVNRDRFAEETVARTVCRHAVKANDTLQTEEIKRLLMDLHACSSPFTCPHGRPTMLRLTQAELEKKFGRRPE